MAITSAKKVEKLTEAQKARFPEFVDKWIKIGLSTEPADRLRAEKAIAGLYRLANRKEPRVIWLPCPISAALSAVCYAAIINHRPVERKGQTRSAVDSVVRSAVGGAVGSAVGSAVGGAVGSAVGSAVRSAVGSAVYSAVDSAVGSAVRSAVGSAVGSAVYSAVDSAVDSVVRSAVRSAVGSAVGSAVYSAVDSAVDSVVRSAVRSAVGGAVGSAVGSAVYSAVDSAVGSAVRSAVGSAVGSAVYSAVDSAVDSVVRSAVRSAVGGAVGSAVGSAVYSAVDSAVRSAVGSAVGSAVYSAVDSAVDSVVRSAVRSAVGGAVGSAVGSAGHSYFGGSIWNAGYSAWADYFDEVCAVAIDRNFLEMTASAGFYWMLDGVCFASERPSKIASDAEGRLHCETGQAIEYAGTGWGLTAWHGVVVPRVWIERRADLTVAEIFKETSAERRRAGCEIIGWDRVLSGIDATLIDNDGDPLIGSLYEGQIPGATRCTFLKVQCGTGRVFVIPTAPSLKTALQAQLWIRNHEIGGETSSRGNKTDAEIMRRLMPEVRG